LFIRQTIETLGCSSNKSVQRPPIRHDPRIIILGELEPNITVLILRHRNAHIYVKEIHTSFTTTHVLPFRQIGVQLQRWRDGAPWNKHDDIAIIIFRLEITTWIVSSNTYAYSNTVISIINSYMFRGFVLVQIFEVVQFSIHGSN
jgi:hypothetical protein